MVGEIKRPAVRRRPYQRIPDCESRDDPPLPPLGQPVHQRSQQVLLHRKPAIRRLHPIRAAHTRDFACEALLARRVAHVLDHGVAEDHVESAIAEGQHPPGTTAKEVQTGNKHREVFVWIPLIGFEKKDPDKGAARFVRERGGRKPDAVSLFVFHPDIVHHHDGTTETVTPGHPRGSGRAVGPAAAEPVATAPTWTADELVVARLGDVVHARSGDKGGDANVGVWVRDRRAWDWLRTTLTVEELRRLLPEARDLVISRYELPNLGAVNFVLHGLLGSGATSSLRLDAQAKALGEWLRARSTKVPRSLVEAAPIDEPAVRR